MTELLLSLLYYPTNIQCDSPLLNSLESRINTTKPSTQTWIKNCMLYIRTSNNVGLILISVKFIVQSTLESPLNDILHTFIHSFVSSCVFPTFSYFSAYSVVPVWNAIQYAISTIFIKGYPLYKRTKAPWTFVDKICITNIQISKYKMTKLHIFAALCTRRWCSI